MKSSDEENTSPIILTPLATVESSLSSKNESYKVASLANTDELKLTQNRDVEDDENLINKLSQILPQTPSEPIKDLNLDLDRVENDGFENLVEK
jgi:hypothetical protein